MCNQLRAAVAPAVEPLAGTNSINAGLSLGDAACISSHPAAIFSPPSPQPAPQPRLAAGASLADEGPPETTTLRLQRGATICIAPVDIAEDLLRAEGFTDVRYVPDLP